MTADQKYTTLQQSKRLKELGVNVESEWVYVLDFNGESGFCHIDDLGLYRHIPKENYFPRHDVPELLGMLPTGHDVSRFTDNWYEVFNDSRFRIAKGDTAADALAKAIIKGVERGLSGFDVDEINERAEKK